MTAAKSSMSFKGSERVTFAKFSSQECEGPYFIVRFDLKAQHSCATCADEHGIHSLYGRSVVVVDCTLNRFVAETALQMSLSQQGGLPVSSVRQLHILARSAQVSVFWEGM